MMRWAEGFQTVLGGRGFAIVLLGAAFAGCLSSILDPSSTPSASSSAFRARMSNFFFGTAMAQGTQQEQPASTADPDMDCPSVDIRTGASTYQIRAGGESDVNTLRYQAVIARVARECVVRGTTMTIKVGVQGRVIVGPAGGSGKLDVPLRYALVKEGPEPKTILTKLHKFPVAVAEGQTNVPFTHIEEDITFQVPRKKDLEDYVVYVGFDPAAITKEQPKKSRRAR
jgi:hypothetical protein